MELHTNPPRHAPAALWVTLATTMGLAAGGACGAGGPEQSLARTRDPGDPTAAPSMRALPTMDIEHRDLSRTMKFAWELAEQSFQLPPPPQPSGRASTSEVQAWTSGELRDWLRRKDQLVEAARAEMNAASEQNLRNRILAGAIVGLMYEDIGRVMLDVPVPREIQEDPEIAPVFQNVVIAHARPYLLHADANYAACSQNAQQLSGMSHWSGFCAARRERLPGGVAEPQSGETRVTVTRE